MEENKRGLLWAGLIATSVCLAALWLVSAIAPKAVPFPPTSLADAIIRLAPGSVSTFFIDLLKDWAIKLLGLGVIVATVALGSISLTWSVRDGKPRPFLVGAALAVLAGIAIVAGPADRENVVAMVIVLGGIAVMYPWVVRRTLAALPEAGAETFDADRRRVLRAGLGGAAGLVVAGGVIGYVIRRFGGPDTNVPLVAPATPAVIPERPPFPEIPGLASEITSVADHYVVDINLVQPSVSADGWTLSVHGLVDEELSFTFDSLQKSFDVVEEYSVLACISNEVGGDLIGSSLWGGVRLRDVLERAGIGPGAVDVVFRSDDGYSDSIPLEVAMDPSVLLAVSQNREPLTQEHGFPCRVRVPMIYGMKNVKWLSEIEVVDHDFKGYWMERGWSDDAVIRTQSRIDVAGDGLTAAAGSETWIAGVAWAGGRGVDRVEVSTDGGQSWTDAMLKPPVSRHAWTLWAYQWTPDRSGDVDVMCRATDGQGEVQTSDVAPPHPAGATGLHRVRVTVA